MPRENVSNGGKCEKKILVLFRKVLADRPINSDNSISLLLL
jgi:hypothetical protein